MKLPAPFTGRRDLRWSRKRAAMRRTIVANAWMALREEADQCY